MSSDTETYQIPESTFAIRDLAEMIKKIEKAAPPLKNTEIDYFDAAEKRKSAADSSDLETSLRGARPLRRSYVRFLLEGQFPVGSSTKKIKGTVSLSNKKNRSSIEVVGPKKHRQDVVDHIRACLQPFERKVTNKLGGIVVPVVAGIAILALNFRYPDSVFGNTKYATVIATFLIAVGHAYYYLRPHCLIRETVFEELILFFNLHEIVNFLPRMLLVFTGLTGSALYLPQFLGTDAFLVRNDIFTQKHVLRNLLSVGFLEKAESLKQSAALFDKASPAEQHSPAVASSIVFALHDLIEGKSSLEDYPIGKLDYFVSSARRVSQGNWLQDPALLGMILDPKQNQFVYRPRILDNDPSRERRTTFSDWKTEVVLKDKYGNTWTRESLIEDLYREANGTLSPDRREALERLRKFPEEKFSAQLPDGREITPQNSVLNSTVRATGEELIRSLNVIQRELSADPEKTRE